MAHPARHGRAHSVAPALISVRAASAMLVAERPDAASSFSVISEPGYVRMTSINRIIGWWGRLRGFQVTGVQVAESYRGCRAAGEVGQQVDTDIRPREQAHHRGAKCHSGIESATADFPDRHGAGEHREADRQPVKRVPRVISGGRGCEHPGHLTQQVKHLGVEPGRPRRDQRRRNGLRRETAGGRVTLAGRRAGRR